MTRPNLFIVGAPKCGTTAWYSYLGAHPQIFFPEAKEPHYFNTDMPGFRWFTDEAAYLQLFARADAARIVGEASVHYLCSTEAPSAIARFAPEARILIFTRAPAAFLRSYHNQQLLNLDETEPDLAKLWQMQGQSPPRALPETCRDPKLLDYRDAASFGAHLRRYLSVFQPEQIMLVPYETWTQAPRATYQQILDFLEVPDDGRTDFDPVHSAKHVASQRVARLTQRPPGWALWGARALRRLLGRERLGLAGVMRRANNRKGYGARPADPTLDAEITAWFAEDQALLRELTQKVRHVRL